MSCRINKSYLDWLQDYRQVAKLEDHDNEPPSPMGNSQADCGTHRELGG